MKPNGKLLIGVPNVKGINSRIAKGYWYYLGAPVHTFNYSANNLKMLLEKNNFICKKIRYVSSSNGILGSLEIYMNRNGGMPKRKAKLLRSWLVRKVANIVAKIENLMKTGDCIEIEVTKK